MFSSQTKGPLFSALYMRTCTVEGHTLHACTRTRTHTHKETHAQSQPSCRHSDLAVTHRQWLHSSVLLALHSSLLLLLLFTKQHRTLLSPEEKEQNLQEEHSRSVVLLYTGEQHPFDWEPGVRAWLPKPAGFFGVCVCVCKCLCMHALVFLECVCCHLHVLALGRMKPPAC